MRRGVDRVETVRQSIRYEGKDYEKRIPDVEILITTIDPG